MGPLKQLNASPRQWSDLAEAAWNIRTHAYIFGNTKVGCAVLGSNGQIYTGCNIEHRFRCHDIHAEVNAIANMVAQGETKILAVIVVAERDYFTPCGGCMDWIMQFGDDKTIVAFQNHPGKQPVQFSTTELMPQYPR